MDLTESTALILCCPLPTVLSRVCLCAFSSSHLHPPACGVTGKMAGHTQQKHCTNGRLIPNGGAKKENINASIEQTTTSGNQQIVKIHYYEDML